MTNEALRLLGVYTANRFDIWNLAGPAKASCRAHIMSVLCEQKMPQSKSGVNALREKLYALAQRNGAVMDGDCIAVREDQFINWCRTHIAPRPLVGTTIGDLFHVGYDR